MVPYFTLNFPTRQSHKNSDSAAVQPIFVTLAHWKVEQIFGKLSLSTVPVQFTFFNESTNSARCTSQSSQSTKITNRAGIICARYCKYVEYFTFFLEISASWASIESLTFRGSCEFCFQKPIHCTPIEAELDSKYATKKQEKAFGPKVMAVYLDNLTPQGRKFREQKLSQFSQLLFVFYFHPWKYFYVLPLHNYRSWLAGSEWTKICMK